jgi:hypothetical protein
MWKGKWSKDPQSAVWARIKAANASLSDIRSTRGAQKRKVSAFTTSLHCAIPHLGTMTIQAQFV